MTLLRYFMFLISFLAALGCESRAHVTEGSVVAEYIVVGSGAGGGTLAARLARLGHSVLLLEAGEDEGGKLQYQVPAMNALAAEDPDLAWWFWVRHHTDAAIDRTDSKYQPEGILYPRGSALGGSTAVNALVTVLPSPSDWNRIAELTGDAAWRAPNMTASEDRVREWLSIELADPKLALGDRQVTDFLMAAARSSSDSTVTSTAALSSLLNHDVNDSLRVGEATGMFRLPLATRDGQRNGTRENLLDTVAAGYPLTIVTRAFVKRVLWDPRASVPTAVGVEFVRSKNVYAASLAQRPAPQEQVQVFATREVILAAGTFNSPQLLMLSGIGDRQQLEALGLSVVAHRPGVGLNLQDRSEIAVVHQLGAPVSLLQGCALGHDGVVDPCLDDWRAHRGVYRTPGFLASVLRKSAGSAALADLQIFAVPSDARGYFPGYAKVAADAKDRFSWVLLKAHTRNRDGTVRLRDASPFSRPEINFHSYDEQSPLTDPDLLALVEGVNFVRTMRGQLTDTAVAEIWPGPAVQTDAQLAEWIRKESWGHHACCTSRMGRIDDPLAVVDSHFRVIGTSGLRVVDASVFPEIPGTFIAFPLFMAAEHAAAVIVEDRP